MPKTRLLAAGLALALAAATSAAPDADEASLRFVTAPPANELKLSIDQPAFGHELVIEATQAGKDVRVEATDLVGPERVPLACTVGGQPCAQAFALEAGSAKTVRLSARLDTAGSYAAVVSLAGAGKRQSYLLSVTRSAAPFPVELAASMVGASTRRSSLALQVPLQEKFGRAAQLNLPSLVLTRRETGRTASEAASVSARFSVGDKPLTAPWQLAARDAPVLLVDIGGLDQAGEYSGRLRFTSPSSLQVLDVPLTLSKSDSGLLAAVLIALGAFASFLLRLYLKTARPRLVQQRSAALLAMDLERLRSELNDRFAPLQRVEAAVVSALSERLAALGEQVEMHTEAEAKAVLDEVDSKLSLVRRWVNARRRAAALEALPTPVRNTLVKVGEFLERAGVKDAEVMGTELRDAEQKIAEAEAEESTKRIDALHEALKAAPYIDAPSKARLLPALQAAASIIDAGEQRTRLEAIELELVDAQLAGLAREIDATNTPPIGFDATSWPALTAEMKSRLDTATAALPRERGTLLRAAVAHYLGRVHAALAARAQKQQQVIAAHASMPPDEQAAFKARAQAALDALAAVPASIKAGKLDEAAAAVADQGAAVAALQTALGSGGWLSEDAGTVAKAAPVPAGLDLETAAFALLSGLGLRGRRLADTSPAGLSAWIGKLDWLVLAVALGVSVLLGLKLLWVDNPTWGSVNDYVVALLWGLGLHQISNAAFEGIGGVMDKFTK